MGAGAPGGAYSTQGQTALILTRQECNVMAKKRSSSKAWLKEHRDDPYVQQAQREGYRSRACYKLLELQEKDRLIKTGMTVVDLGSAPGGWVAGGREPGRSPWSSGGIGHFAYG